MCISNTHPRPCPHQETVDQRILHRSVLWSSPPHLCERRSVRFDSMFKLTLSSARPCLRGTGYVAMQSHMAPVTEHGVVASILARQGVVVAVHPTKKKKTRHASRWRLAGRQSTIDSEPSADAVGTIKAIHGQVQSLICQTTLHQEKEHQPFVCNFADGPCLAVADRFACTAHRHGAS